MQILSWLEKQNLINERGVPKFILEKSFIPEINLNEEEFKDIPKVIDKYFNVSFTYKPIHLISSTPIHPLVNLD